MKLSTFLSFILVLTVGWMQFYSAVRETYNGISDLKAELERMRKASDEEHLHFALQREQFLEFRQNVATLMPGVVKEHGLGEEGYPYRSLASTIVKSAKDDVRKAIVKTLFESGKEHFRKKNYPKAAKLFRQVIDRYSYSHYVTESYFLLSESHYLENELEEATTVIQQMVELFPSHELTGFALIRLGRIYEGQNRNEEAVDIYKTVLRSYPQRDVASQAKASLRGLDL
jgi:TolA-binding protein